VVDWKFLEIRDVLETLHAWSYTRGPDAVKQEAMRSNPILRLWRAAVAALVAVLVAPSFLAAALTPGQILQDALPIGGKRIPLPEGPWRVAGIGTQDVDRRELGAYGAILNAVLFRVEGDAVVAVLEANVNALGVNDGWGRTRACRPGASWTIVVRYATGWETSCLFLRTTHVAIGDEEPPAWREAKAHAVRSGLRLPSVWLTAGFRTSDRQDLVDARFHFDPALFVGTAESAPRLEDWTAEAIRADQSRRGAAEILTLWALGFDARIERGLRNRPMPGPAPMPLVAALASDTPTVDAKLAGLESLYRGGLLPERAYLEQSAAALVEMPRRVDSDPALLSPALRKNLSFRFFGSIVDYLLALVVTANHAVSGAITATIVLVHSVVFVLNDNYWDDYWAQRVTRDSERIVDFLQIGGT